MRKKKKKKKNTILYNRLKSRVNLNEARKNKLRCIDKL